MKRWLALVLLSACVTSRPDEMSGEPDTTPTAPSIDEAFVPLAANALAADDSMLYFAAGTTLQRVPVAGGAPTTLFTATPSSANNLFGLAQIVVGSTDLLFVTAELDPKTQAATKTLFTMPKAGGTATMLGTSNDSRAFMGATFDGDDVVYSSFTSLFRVPRAGGTAQLVGQSEGDTKYWIYSPVATPDSWVWTSEGVMYRLPRSNSDKTGKAFAALPETGMIIATGSALVLALSPSIEHGESFDAIAEVEPTTGNVGTRVPLGVQAQQVAVTANAAWAATFHGLARVPRAGGAAELMTRTFTRAVATSGHYVFAASPSGITRVVE